MRCTALLLASLSIHLSHGETLDKVLFGEAYCLDGSVGGYYLKERPASTGWVVVEVPFILT